MSTNASFDLESVVKRAFLEVHEGRSTDDVVIDSDLNQRFLETCNKLAPEIRAFDANWKLLNLRKSSSLGKVTTKSERFQHGDYQHAAQIAARLMEDRLGLTVDRILCDPDRREEFDEIACSASIRSAL